ncbi:hypothetical protein [Qipengyuania sp. MTN3-11]|uniref:hypothetical protein n=1 Tax=Qipengyuania sp. MTN3-11 TaxID=3056557 RepID=UPI0036F3C6CF
MFLPPAPQGSGGEDSIETAEGTRCRQSINSSGPYLDVGVTGRSGSELPEPPEGSTFFTYPQDRDREALAYVRMTIPLGRRPERIDCSRLYELEIARLRQEVELLRMAAE